VSGTAAGGGYELALATDWIVLADDGNSAISLPEVPLLGVLPGTGGLTRLVDKRKVRRDRADVFCTTEEGVKGQRALEWKLVDELASRTRFEEVVKQRALQMAEQSDRPAEEGITLEPLERELGPDGIEYSHLRVEFDRALKVARFVVEGPSEEPPADVTAMRAVGSKFWPLALARQLDDAVLHLRVNETRLGMFVFASEGDLERVAAHDAFLAASASHWLAREILLFWKRVLKRVDLSARTVFTLIEPGSCFAGLLAELVFAADRSYMLDGELEGNPNPAPSIRLSPINFGALPMANGLTRLETRFLGEPERYAAARELAGESGLGRPLDAEAASEAGLVTAVMDEIDWEDEIRIAIEERASFSADSLTGLEANLRFAGPETMETKIFGRLSAWQNWIFQRPNAVGADGALKRYGTGLRPAFDPERV
jgi:benzoyl-CoA-dihydrodiol lyase